jgi:A/G-specific adenine glycosylase
MSNSSTELHQFQTTVWDYYQAHHRSTLPWRNPRPDGIYDPYAITVSEIMLQQTQVSRVVPKYQAFLTTFPTIASVATAPLAAVLTLWSGLGYNRRAKFLHEAMRRIHTQYQDQFPTALDELVTLPGIGHNTAGAILAYSFDQPVVFIETNIRTVFIHHFFVNQVAVSDKAIAELLIRTLPPEGSREWYWALMDYGSWLKQTIGNPNRLSKGYTKQTPFNGSLRQIRGSVLRRLRAGPHTATELRSHISDDRLSTVLEDLTREGLISSQAGRYSLG